MIAGRFEKSRQAGIMESVEKRMKAIWKTNTKNT